MAIVTVLPTAGPHARTETNRPGHDRSREMLLMHEALARSRTPAVPAPRYRARRPARRVAMDLAARRTRLLGG